MFRHRVAKYNDHTVTDHRFNSNNIGKGDEFKVALQSCRDHYPEIPIYVFTNVEVIDPSIRKYIHRAYQVDLMVESGADVLYEKDNDALWACATKPQSLITGWEWDVLPHKVLFFDSDIAMMGTHDKNFNIYNFFEPLQVWLIDYMRVIFNVI